MHVQDGGADSEEEEEEEEIDPQTPLVSFKATPDQLKLQKRVVGRCVCVECWER